MILWIFAAGAGLLAAGLYGLRVGLIGRRTAAEVALSSIDVQLKRRYEPLPNAIRLAQKAPNIDKALLDELAALHANVEAPYRKNDSSAIDAHLEAARKLNRAVSQFFLAARQNPNLCNVPTLLHARKAYEETALHLLATQRFYNSAVKNLNDALRPFPESLVAAIADVRPMPYDRDALEKPAHGRSTSERRAQG